MAISKKDVEHLAHLSRLDLSQEEINIFVEQLEGILNYIDKLKQVDIAQIPATSHPLDLKNVFREDIPKPSLPVKKVLEFSPSKLEDFFRVTKVIE